MDERRALSSLTVVLLVCAGLIGCVTDADRTMRQQAMESHAKCALESCYRVGRIGRSPEDAIRAYPLDCLGQRAKLASAMTKSVPLADVRSNALRSWDNEVSGVCLRSYWRGKADHCSKLRQDLETKRLENVQREIIELLEREYARVCS